jgi:hypothetical protein
MTIQFYTWLHLAGIGLTLLAVGGLAHGRDSSRKLLSIAHGVGLLVALVGGFGLVAKYGIPWPWPGWLVVKVVLWLIFGASTALLKRKPHLSTPIWWGAWGLFLIAAYLGVHRPF